VRVNNFRIIIIIIIIINDKKIGLYVIEGNARKAIFGLCVTVSPKPYEIGQRLVLISNKKPILCTKSDA